MMYSASAGTRRSLVTHFTTGTGAFRAAPIRASSSTGGVIDSFAVLELVADSEEAFGIQYTPEDFQDRSFATIDGLTAIILARR